MNAHSRMPSTLTGEAAQAADTASLDPMSEVAGLMNRLLQDPESDAAAVPQLVRFSENLPAGPAKGALESSMAALGRLRSWLQQLQARQRMHTRFSDVSARLSRIEGLHPLMEALADEARRLLDAPLSRLDAFPPLLVGAGEQGARASSGEFISRLPHVGMSLSVGLVARAAQGGAPVLVHDVAAAIPVPQDAGEFEQQLRAEGLHGLVIVPLLMEGHCCGLLVVGDRVMRPWTSLDVESLQHLATVAVRAIGRAARADAAQHALRALHERHRAARLQADPLAGAASGDHADGGSPPLSAEQEPALSGLLEGTSARQRSSYVKDMVGTLLKADQARGTALALTLLTYMDHGHNARAAARVLGVHVNTLHNRLEAITTLMPGWGEPGRCLDVHLALRLSAVGSTGGASRRVARRSVADRTDGAAAASA